MLKFFIQQFVLDTLGDKLGKILGVAGCHFSLAYFFAQHLPADGVHQQARSCVGVVWIFFDQGSGGQNGRLVHLINRHAVIKVAHGFSHDGVWLDALAQIGTGRFDQRLQVAQVKRYFFATVHDMQQYCCGRFGVRLACAFLGPLFTVKDVSPRDFMVAAAHEPKFDLILHIFDVESTASWARAHQRACDDLG